MAKFSTFDRHFIPTVYSCYFFNDTHGIIGIDGVNGIYVTYDGGTTWIASNIPFGYYGVINDIFMNDSLNGWAVLEDQSSFARCLWKTMDGGVSWTEIPGLDGALFTSVYQTPTTVLLSSRYTTPSLGISTNGGISFGGGGLDYYNDIDFVDDVHGVATSFRMAGGPGYGNALWTADAGLTWYTNNLYMECWGVYAKKGTPTFFAAGEASTNANIVSENALRSDNYGRNWRVVGTVPDRTTGDIKGVGDVLYVQTWTRNQYPSRYVGLLRSIDGGASWTPVGGPSNYRDCRFWVGNCHGRTIFAFDEDGGVWRSDDGGDGTITDGLRNPFLTPSQVDLTADKCTTVTAISTLLQMSCKSMIIEDISFVDSTDEAVTSGALQVLSEPQPGAVLEFGKPDTISFLWDPSKLSGPKAKTSILLRVHTVADDSSAEFDTLISVNVTSTDDYPLYSLSQSKIALDSMNICGALVDTMIDVANHGCDTLFLDDAQMSGASDWVVLAADGSTLSLPLTIPVDSIGHFLLRFKPTNSGLSNASVGLILRQSGSTKDTTLALSGIAYRTLSVTADQSMRFAPTSICTTTDTVLHITNNSCDTLVIDSLNSSDSSMYELYSGLLLPIRIPPDGILSVPVRYHPQRNVGLVAQVGYAYHIQGDSGKAFTSVVGLGISGTSVFASSLNSQMIHFANRLDCEPGDSTMIDISNLGCDSMKIISATLTGATSSPFVFHFDNPLPIGLINNGKYLGLSVVLDSTGAGVYNGTLMIRYAAADGSLHDTSFSLSASIQAAPHIASLNKTVVDLGTNPFCSYLLDTIYIRNDGCPPLSVNSIAVTGADYTLVYSRATPFIIPAMARDSVIVALSPSAVGSHTGSLIVETNDENKPQKLVQLTANVQPVDVVTFRVAMANPNMFPGDTAQIDVIPNLDWSRNGLSDISFAISYDSNLLGYTPKTISYDPNNSVLTTAVAIPNEREQVNVQIAGNPEIILQKDKPIASFFLRSFLTDTLTTPISLNLLEVNKGDSHYSNCILRSATSDAVATLQFACGEQTLQNYMRTKQILVAGSPHPDPAFGQAGITFPLSTAVTGEVVLSVFDDFGRKVLTQSVSVIAGKAVELHVDGESLISGAYSYELHLNGISSASVRGRFVVLQ